MTVVAAAVFNDLIADHLRRNPEYDGRNSHNHFGISHTIWLILGFSAVVLIVLRWCLTGSCVA